jgi:hypothetical protein
VQLRKKLLAAKLPTVPGARRGGPDLLQTSPSDISTSSHDNVPGENTTLARSVQVPLPTPPLPLSHRPPVSPLDDPDLLTPKFRNQTSLRGEDSRWSGFWLPPSPSLALHAVPLSPFLSSPNKQTFNACPPQTNKLLMRVGRYSYVLSRWNTKLTALHHLSSLLACICRVGWWWVLHFYLLHSPFIYSVCGCHKE